MSHGIRVHEDGRATFMCVDEGAWHGLVEPVKGPVTVWEALELANMTGLEYHTQPLYVIAEEGDDVDLLEVPDKYTMVARNPFDKTWEAIGGYVTDKYVAHTIEQVAEVGEALAQAADGATVSAVGLIDEGRRMFMSFKLREWRWGGDKMHAWLNAYTDFTGGMATLYKPGGTRVICHNTFHIGLAEQVEQQFRARHTGLELVDRIAEARAALGFAERALDAFEVEVQQMLDTEVTATQFEKIVAQFAPIKKDDTLAVKAKQEKVRDELTRVWKSPTVATIQGTAWGAYNALTEYVDWTGGSYRTADSRLVASLTPGSRMDLERNRALAVVRKVVLV